MQLTCASVRGLLHVADAAAFGALRECVFASKRIKLATKKEVYLTLVVNILLYGSECWCLTEALLHRLRVFHHHCLRVMLGVRRSAVWRCSIRTSKLLEGTPRLYGIVLIGSPDTDIK